VVAGGLMTWPWGHYLMWWAGRRSLCLSDLDQEEEGGRCEPGRCIPWGAPADGGWGGGWWRVVAQNASWTSWWAA
jgi:hypothetical protein